MCTCWPARPFSSQSLCVLDVSRTLGNGPWRTFFTVALPLARPAIVAGLSLALMETLADYGTVQYFGVATFTTGIFRTWFGLGSAPAAAQLSAVLLGFVLVLILVERFSRRRARYHHTSQREQAIQRHRLGGWWAAAAFGVLPDPGAVRLSHPRRAAGLVGGDHRHAPPMTPPSSPWSCIP